VSRHDTDLTSLIAGLVFLFVGIAYLLDAADVMQVDAKWVVPLGLIGLGLAGVAGSLRRALGTREEPPPEQPADESAAEENSTTLT
jgi:hypothetical protein